MKAQIIQYILDSLEVSKEEAEEFFELYLDTLQEHCEQMTAAIAKSDFAGIRSLTHSLTGCSGNIGAEAVIETVRKINTAAKALDVAACDAAFQILKRQYTALRAEQC